MSYVLTQAAGFNLAGLGTKCTGWKDGTLYYFVAGQLVSGARARFLKLSSGTLSSLQQLTSPNDVNMGGVDTWIGAGGTRYVAIAWLTATGTQDELRIYEVAGETLTQVAQVTTNSVSGEAVRVTHDAAGARALIALGTSVNTPHVWLYEWDYAAANPSLLASTETGEYAQSVTRPWLVGSDIRFATGGRNGTLTVREFSAGSITTVASLNITVGSNRVRGLTHLGAIGGDEQFACALQQDNTTRETLIVVKLDESGAPALSTVVGLNPNGNSSDANDVSFFAAPFGAGAAADDLMLVWSAVNGDTPLFRIVRYKPSVPSLVVEDSANVGGQTRGNVAIASGTDGLEIIGVTASSNPEFVVFEAEAPTAGPPEIRVQFPEADIPIGELPMTGLQYAVFTQPLPANWTAPALKGNNGVIDGSRLFVLDVTGTFTGGETVFIYISNSDGTLNPFTHHGGPIIVQGG